MKNKMIKTMTLLAASALTLGATAPVFAAEATEATEEVAVVDEAAEEATEETAEEADEETTEETAEVSPVVGLWEGVSKDVAVTEDEEEVVMTMKGILFVQIVVFGLLQLSLCLKK